MYSIIGGDFGFFVLLWWLQINASFKTQLFFLCYCMICYDMLGYVMICYDMLWYVMISATNNQSIANLCIYYVWIKSNNDVWVKYAVLV